MLHQVRTICNVSSSSKFSNWILETGATDHIRHTLSEFQFYRKINPVLVKLLDGTQISTHFAGTVLFSEFFFLNDALYTPNFSFNLISVSKLVNSLNSQLIFSKSACLVNARYSDIIDT